MTVNILAVLDTTTEELIAKYGNKSKAIRALYAEGYKQYAIAKALDIRPQMVSNVVNNPLKKG